jgi:hypothetical protein
MNRRAVFAEALLMADPSELEQRDETSLRIEFDTITELRSWLAAAGLDTPDLLASETSHVTPDGRPYRSMHAYPTWHGWEIYAEARDYDDVAPLDEPTRDQLRELASTGGTR